MPFEILPHTADVRVHCSGATREELFRSALKGMMAVAKPKEKKEQKGAAVRRSISVEAPDATALLVDFLNEALAWMHTEREAYTEVVFLALDEQTLEADLEGYHAEYFSEDIKAVTYHEVEVVREEDGGWSTMIVFDI
jgi:SHS2 domain-containing protein